MDPTIANLNKQDSRTFLRERFLRLMSKLNGQEAEISLHEKTRVTGTLRAMDINVHLIQLSHLQTPIGIIPEAMLRLSDTVAINIPDFKS